jgi:hypothetical protein
MQLLFLPDADHLGGDAEAASHGEISTWIFLNSYVKI